MLQSWFSRLQTSRVEFGAAFLLSLVGLHKYLLGDFNNYLIFTGPFQNLLRHQTIYGPQPGLYVDTFKYSPAFAFLMGAFAWLPTWLGILAWNGLGAGVLLAGLRAWFLPQPGGERLYRTAVTIVFLEALITAQNLQSNNLIAGAILLALRALQGQRPGQAAFWFVLCGFIKFYGAAAAIFFLFYPRKLRFLSMMGIWTAFFAMVPLLLVPPALLLDLYRSWLVVIHESKLGQLVSLLGICESWFGMAKTDANLRILEGLGLLLFLLPLLRRSLWREQCYQQRMLALFLLFIILFNKMAESPTYVLAVVGVALWWTSLKNPSRLDQVLLGLVIVFTSLSPTDLFPRWLQKEVFVPYNIKAVPVVLVWLRLLTAIWLEPVDEAPEPAASPSREIAAEPGR